MKLFIAIIALCLIVPSLQIHIFAAPSYLQKVTILNQSGETVHIRTNFKSGEVQTNELPPSDEPLIVERIDQDDSSKHFDPILSVYYSY